jgi:hypothetical protein
MGRSSQHSDDPPIRTGQLILHWFVNSDGVLSSHWIASDTAVDTTAAGADDFALAG